MKYEKDHWTKNLRVNNNLSLKGNSKISFGQNLMEILNENKDNNSMKIEGTFPSYINNCYFTFG